MIPQPGLKMPFFALTPGIFSLFTLKGGAKKGRKLVDRKLH